MGNLTQRLYRKRGKRAIDVGVSLTALVLLSVPMAVIWLVVRFSMGPPAIYRQERPGRHGAMFRVLKFRTMDDAELSPGVLLPDEERLTGTGRRLRRTSLDELPEFVNVLRGDMSIVGPRPLLPQYLGRYTREQARRLEVRPGITGWAQVNGRNAITWEEKFALDVWYVDHHDLRLDLRILWLTLMQVIQRSGINAEGHATMPEFMGNEEESR